MILSAAFLAATAAADCAYYRKVVNNSCADDCVPSTLGICPRALIVKEGGLDAGKCADIGYTVDQGEQDQKAGPCGTLKFEHYGKATQLVNSTADGCTKDSCPFSYQVPPPVRFGRCGEVDAASRMPADIWDDPRAFGEYVEATLLLWSVGTGPTGGALLKQEKCPSGWTPMQGKTVPWTQPKLMEVTCDLRCNCRYPDCKDVPDDPKDHTYCSLCGPKFNAPIEVKFFLPPPAPGPAPGPGTVCKATEYCCPDAKKCLTPTSTSCRFDPNACHNGEVCCPLTKICVVPGADCKTPCADQGAFCCPDAKACLTPVKAKVGLFCDPAIKDACATGEVCCPLIKQCVTAGDKCTSQCASCPH